MNKIKFLTMWLLAAASLLNFAASSKAQDKTKADVVNSPNEDVILQWNRVLTQTIQIPDAQPPTILPNRSYAMMHLAMFDAVNSIDGSYTPYLSDIRGFRNASVKAAAAQAAYEVLVSLYPNQQAMFATELAQSLNGIRPAQLLTGRTIGHLVAARMIANRANDGWSAPWTPYILPPTPGNWQETSPGPYPGFAVFTNFSGVTPFALTQNT